MGSSAPPHARRTRHAPTTTTAPRVTARRMIGSLVPQRLSAKPPGTRARESIQLAPISVVRWPPVGVGG
jgi:hypothetical protein